MTSRHLRRLEIGTSVYRWRVDHRHASVGADGERQCAESFSAFVDGFRASPLRISFPETEEHGPSFPRQSGVVCDYQPPPWHLNLNRPKAARLLIEIALLVGWTPLDARQPFILTNGYDLLRAHRELLESYLKSVDAERPV